MIDNDTCTTCGDPIAATWPAPPWNGPDWLAYWHTSTGQHWCVRLPEALRVEAWENGGVIDVGAGPTTVPYATSHIAHEPGVLTRCRFVVVLWQVRTGLDAVGVAARELMVPAVADAARSLARFAAVAEVPPTAGPRSLTWTCRA